MDGVALVVGEALVDVVEAADGSVVVVIGQRIQMVRFSQSLLPQIQ